MFYMLFMIYYALSNIIMLNSSFSIIIYFNLEVKLRVKTLKYQKTIMIVYGLPMTNLTTLRTQFRSIITSKKNFK